MTIIYFKMIIAAQDITASETSKKLIIVEIKNPSSKKNQQWRKACRDVKESMQRESESSRASV